MHMQIYASLFSIDANPTYEAVLSVAMTSQSEQFLFSSRSAELSDLKVRRDASINLVEMAELTTAIDELLQELGAMKTQR